MPSSVPCRGLKELETVHFKMVHFMSCEFHLSKRGGRIVRLVTSLKRLMAMF